MQTQLFRLDDIRVSNDDHLHPLGISLLWIVHLDHSLLNEEVHLIRNFPRLDRFTPKSCSCPQWSSRSMWRSCFLARSVSPYIVDLPGQHISLQVSEDKPDHPTWKGNRNLLDRSDEHLISPCISKPEETLINSDFLHRFLSVTPMSGNIKKICRRNHVLLIMLHMISYISKSLAVM